MTVGVVKLNIEIQAMPNLDAQAIYRLNTFLQGLRYRYLSREQETLLTTNIICFDVTR